MKRFLFLPVAIILVAGCHRTDPRNPYNLPIANTMKTYLEQVKENPDTELVDLEEVIPGIALHIAYATEENFTGVPIYTSAKAFLCHSVVMVLVVV